LLEPISAVAGVERRIWDGGNRRHMLWGESIFFLPGIVFLYS
jgi:hypothetical protein